MTDTPKSLDELRSDTADLVVRVGALADEWDASDEVDTNLGTDVQNAGILVMTLLGDLSKAAKESDPLRTRQLSREAAELHEAIEFYEQLDEHQTDASIDIFDRLGSGVSLASRVLDVLLSPDANHGITNAELVEHLREFPAHMRTYRPDQSSPDGYVPLSGAIALGHDPDPGPGEPSEFLILGAQR